MRDAAPALPAPIGADVLLVNDRVACRLLGGVSARWLWGQSQPRGPIPVCRIGGRVLYSPEALRAFIAQQEAASAVEVSP